MRKSLCFALCAIIMVAICCNFNIATVANAEGQDIYFVDPTGVAVVGDYLYVADTVEEGSQNILHIFKLSDGADGTVAGKPVAQNTINNFDNTYGKIVSVSGSETPLNSDTTDLIGSLYINYGTAAELYNVKNDGSLVKSDLSYTAWSEIGDITDVCVGKFAGKDAVYAVSDKLYYHTYDATEMGILNNLTNATSVVYAKDASAEKYFAYYFANGTCNRYEVSPSFSMTGITISNVSDIKLTSGFNYNDGTNNLFVVYNENNAYTLNNQGANNFALSDKAALTVDPENAVKIVSIATSKYGIYVLESTNKVVLYNYASGEFKSTNAVQVGSDTVNLEVPTEFNSYTLAKSTGYPTNILYKTKGENSIDNAVNDYKENVIILGYEGAENCPYYYVLVGNNKFAWIKKSYNEEGTATVSKPTEDKKLTIENTTVSATVKYTANFTSLNYEYVYKLPFENSTKTEVKQKADAPITATLLQKFTWDNLSWYYVSYDADGTTSYGFVKNTSLGKFSSKVSEEQGVVVLEKKKINATLFEAVTIYADRNLDEGTEICDENGIAVKLYSGQRVNVLSYDEENNSCEVYLVHDDGSYDYGWISASRLIYTSQITTNALVGLITLGCAIILGVVLYAVFKAKKDKEAYNKPLD